MCNVCDAWSARTSIAYCSGTIFVLSSIQTSSIHRQARIVPVAVNQDRCKCYANSINNGLDVQMADTNEHLLDLVKEGRISEKTLDESVRRVLRLKFELGLFEEPFVDTEQAAVTVSEGQIADPGEATVLTVSPGTTSGTWAFHTGTGYLSANASNNILKEAPSQSSFTDWSVIISNQKATLKAGDGASRFIRYHASNGRFSCYSSATSQKDIVLYRMKSYETGPVADDPLTVQSEYGSYISGAERTYVKGTDQLVRSYPDGDFQFAILRPADKEQLLISGFDPTTLAKGDEVTVTASWRMGKEVLLKEQSFRLTVVKEDGSKVWLGDGSGQGFIIKK